MHKLLNRPRLTEQERILLFKRLALYVRSGVSLPPGLAAIRDGLPSRGGRIVIAVLEETIARGEPLSRGLAQFPHIFDRLSVGFIEAGEMSGTLAMTCDRLSALLEKRSVLRKKLLGACLYPAIVLLSTLGIAAFLVLYVFPKILPILTGFHTRLPFATRMLIAISGFLEHDWIILAVGSALCIVAFCFGLRQPRIRRVYEGALLRLPFIRALYRASVLASLFTTLALLLEAGLRIMPALELLQSTVSSTLYREAFVRIEAAISEGEPFSGPFARYPLLFPRIVSQLIAVGEETGTLRESFRTLAALFTDEFDDASKLLGTLVEPALMIAMGFMVGFIALAIITPIYQVTGSMSAQSAQPNQ